MFKQPFTICSIQFKRRMRSAHGETRTKKLEAAWIVFPIKPTNDLQVMEGYSRALLCVRPVLLLLEGQNSITKALRRAPVGSTSLSGLFPCTSSLQQICSCQILDYRSDMNCSLTGFVAVLEVLRQLPVCL